MKSFRIDQDKKISMYSMSLTILILINATYQNRLLSLIITLLALLSVTKPNNLIPSFFLTSLSSDYFVAFPGMGFTRIFSFIFIISFIINNKKLVIKKDWIIELVIIIIATLFSFFLSNKLDLNALLGNLLNIIVFLVFVNMKMSKIELENTIFNIYVSVILMTSFIFIQNLINPSYLMSGRLSIGANVNENRFAMLLGQLTAFTLGYIFLLKTNFSKILAVLYVGLGLYLMLLSGSRSALIGLLLGSLTSIFILIAKGKNKIKLFTGFTILAGLSNYIFNAVVESNELLSYRFNMEQVISTGGTHRMPRIKMELEHVIPENLLFGVGLTAENETIALAKYTLFPGSSHNFIVSMLTQVGLIGFISHMFFFLKLIIKLIVKLHENVFLIIPLLLILTACFNGIGEVIYNDRLFWNALSLGGICLTTLKYDFDKKV